MLKFKTKLTKAEATCDENTKVSPQEIIEFPSVLLNTKTLEIVDEIQIYVKPRVHPKLTNFCTELTGITQDKTDAGVDIVEVRSQGNVEKNQLFSKKFINFYFPEKIM